MTTDFEQATIRRSETCAIVIVGHGSLRSASGASMVRLAARLREQGVASVVEAGFFNFSRPTLEDALLKCLEQGATQISVQPYFLIAGHYVADDLPRQLRTIMQPFPEVDVSIAAPFLDHPAVVELVLTRIAEVDPALGRQPSHRSELLLMAHGTPHPTANAPIFRVAQQVAARTHYAAGTVCFMECNQPDIPTAMAQAADRGASQIVAMPYFLHMGRHTRDDLPRFVQTAQRQHPACTILLGPHLGYDVRLVDVMVTRLAAATTLTPAA